MRAHQSVPIAFFLVIVLMLIIPMPTWVLDALILINLSLALLVLMVALQVKDPLDFSVFPSLLLLTTLFRLALNVSSTRLILLQANAGTVISAFGNFVVGGNAVVGFIVFLILVIIQYIVITRGAERVSEVAARFTLDAMPGKQMSIDADLNAGLITDDEARRRRRAITREADFYGAMDGASKFVRGDAIAAILIVGINIIGGFVMGLAFLHLGFSQSLQTYTVLSVGDGLVSQLPALIISTATGLLVTRAASEVRYGNELVAQLMGAPRVLYVLAGVVAVLGIFTPIDKVVALLLAVGFVILGRRAEREAQSLAAVPERGLAGAAASAPARNETTLPAPVDPLAVEFGYGLLALADRGQGGELAERIQKVREKLADELGFVMPAVRLRDNLELAPNAYRFLIRGAEVAAGEVMPGRMLAMGEGRRPPAGLAVSDPVFGLPAAWITKQGQDDAIREGFTVVDAGTVLATHFTEVAKAHAHELLSREDVKRVLDRARQIDGAAVDELVPGLLPVGTVHRVFAGLLREGVPIRDVVGIVEALADRAQETKDASALTEYVRQSLSRAITQQVARVGETLYAITLDPALEADLRSRLSSGEGGSQLALDPSGARKLVRAVEERLGDPAHGDSPVALVVSPVLRPHLKRLLARSLKDLPVLSYLELDPALKIATGGVIQLDDERGAVSSA